MCVWVLLECALACKNASLTRFRLIEEAYVTIFDVSSACICTIVVIAWGESGGRKKYR